MVDEVEALVELAKNLGEVPAPDAKWEEWRKWWSTWDDGRSVLVRLRAVEGEPTAEAPRSIVGDRVREIATRLESELRRSLGLRVKWELEDLSMETPRVFLFGGQGGGVEDVHEWFESLDEFEERLGNAVFEDAAGSGAHDDDRVANGQPIAIVDATTWTWLGSVREWRSFLYDAGGEPSDRAFANRNVVLKLAEDDWPFSTYLNLRIGEQVLRFNARRRSLRAENVLQIEDCEVADSDEPGHEVDEGGHAPVALLAELHRNRDARGGFVLRIDEDRAIGLTAEFEGEVPMPGRIPGLIQADAVARGR